MLSAFGKLAADPGQRLDETLAKIMINSWWLHAMRWRQGARTDAERHDGGPQRL
jgi:hypothetical protein